MENTLLLYSLLLIHIPPSDRDMMSKSSIPCHYENKIEIKAGN
jgi:hypothetical protein